MDRRRKTANRPRKSLGKQQRKTMPPKHHSKKMTSETKITSFGKSSAQQYHQRSEITSTRKSPTPKSRAEQQAPPTALNPPANRQTKITSATKSPAQGNNITKSQNATGAKQLPHLPHGTQPTKTTIKKTPPRKCNSAEKYLHKQTPANNNNSEQKHKSTSPQKKTNTRPVH